MEDSERTKAEEIKVKDELENIKTVLFKKTSGMDEIQIKRRKESIEALYFCNEINKKKIKKHCLEHWVRRDSDFKPGNQNHTFTSKIFVKAKSDNQIDTPFTPSIKDYALQTLYDGRQGVM